MVMVNKLIKSLYQICEIYYYAHGSAKPMSAASDGNLKPG
jgi:hypothetical protein